MSDENVPGNHFTATGEEDGNTLVFRSLKTIPEGSDESGYPDLITIYWPYVAADDAGMPDADTNDAQIEFENAIQHLNNKESGHLMLVVTGNSNKEWHWYVASIEEWMDGLNEALAELPAFPIEIENSHQPDWALYHNFLKGVEGI